MSILLSSSFLPVYLLVAPMYQQDNQSKAYRQNSKHYQIKHILSSFVVHSFAIVQLSYECAFSKDIKVALR